MAKAAKPAADHLYGKLARTLWGSETIAKPVRAANGPEAESQERNHLSLNFIAVCAVGCLHLFHLQRGKFINLFGVKTFSLSYFVSASQLWNNAGCSLIWYGLGYNTILFFMYIMLVHLMGHVRFSKAITTIVWKTLILTDGLLHKTKLVVIFDFPILLVLLRAHIVIPHMCHIKWTLYVFWLKKY